MKQYSIATLRALALLLAIALLLPSPVLAEESAGTGGGTETEISSGTDSSGSGSGGTDSGGSASDGTDSSGSGSGGTDSSGSGSGGTDSSGSGSGGTDSSGSGSGGTDSSGSGSGGTDSSGSGSGGTDSSGSGSGGTDSSGSGSGGTDSSGSGSDGTDSSGSAEVTELTLSRSSILMEAGNTVELTASAPESAGHILWATRDPNVASVSAAFGTEITVTAMGPGVTEIVAQPDHGEDVKCAVTVSGATLSQRTIDLVAADSAEITFQTFGNARTVKSTDWKWTTSDVNIAAVQALEEGGGAAIKGIRAGSATITLTGGDFIATCQVTVEVPPATVVLTESVLTMNVGTSGRIRAITNAEPENIAWTVDDKSVASISATSGSAIVVTASRAGSTSIKAQVGNGKPADCRIIVSGVTLTQDAVSLTIGARTTLGLNVYGDASIVTSWDWSSSNTGVAVVSRQGEGAQIQALSPGSAVITCTGGSYAVMCQVTVMKNEAAAIKTTLTGGILRFSDILSDFKKLCQEATKEELDYITTVNVPTFLGTLYDGYVSEGDTGFGVAGNGEYYVDETQTRRISGILFVPKPGVSGTIEISYTGYSKAKKSFSGVVEVPVEYSEATIAYASQNGAAIRFRSEDFSAYSLATTNRSLSYVTFQLPGARYGALYYNYVGGSVYESAVSSSTRYYRTYSPSISNVSFVPNSSYAGNFSLTFTGYDTEGNSFPGSVRISVTNPDGTSAGDSSSTTEREPLHYETGPGGRVSLVLGDFADLCYAQTGYQLNHIRFTSLPASSRGILYYDRTDEVTTGTDYYRSGSTRPISKLSFVAGSSYTGSFTIPFTGYDTQNKSFSSRISITVTEDGAYVVACSVRSGESLTLPADDFNSVCKDATGEALNRVRFTKLPSHGTLKDGSGDAVTTSASYYRSSKTEELLGDVTYTAPETYTGTVSIPYRAYDTDGEHFTGYLRVTVYAPPSASSGGDGTAQYVTTGPAMALRSTDITTPAKTVLDEITTVRITPPPASQGKLYRNYLSPGEYGTFDPTIDYPVDVLSQIFFVPKAGFSGTATATYLAKDRHGIVYSSLLRFRCNVPTKSQYFTDIATGSYAVQPVDFFRHYNILNGTTPTTYEPNAGARRGAFITALSRMYSFPPVEGTGGFEDVAEERYYSAPIAAARRLGIIDANQYFFPDAPITRQDAAVFLYRCMRRFSTAPEGTYADVIRFNDGYSVPYYAVQAMGSMVQLGVFLGDDKGNLNPSQTLTRAQMAAILYRAVT